MKKEIWRDIKNYEGLYQVSNLGKIKSLERKVWNRFAYVTKKERILRPRYDKKGYVKYVLYKNGVKRNYSGHYLVLSTFVKNVDNKSQINHRNGIKSDNRLFNLEYCTPGENIKHALENGLYKNRKKRYHYKKQDPRVCLDKYREKAISKAREVNSIPVCQYTIDDVFVRNWNSLKEAERFYQRRIHIENKSSIGYKWYKLNKTKSKKIVPKKLQV